MISFLKKSERLSHFESFLCLNLEADFFEGDFFGVSGGSLIFEGESDDDACRFGAFGISIGTAFAGVMRFLALFSGAEVGFESLDKGVEVLEISDTLKT